MIKKPAFKLIYCRLCKSKNLKPVLDLGKSPPPNLYLKKSQLKKGELIFPLKVNFCMDCAQVQLSHVVSPEIMYRSYSYVSSTSPVMVAHFKDYAKSVFEKIKLQKKDLVVEIGSNDGVLLQSFKNLGVNILGIDPARNIAIQATKKGIPTLPHFFTANLAKKVAKKYGRAKVITGNNVFAHIHDLDDVIAGVHELLDQNGAFIVEFPYLLDTLDNNVFDTIYHEHLSYLAVKPLDKFFKNFNMEIFDVVRTPVQGGSIRIHAGKKGSSLKRKVIVEKLLDLEKRKKLHIPQTYINFAQNVIQTKKSLNTLLKDLKRKNKRVVGYGAPGRSTTLLNYFGIDTKILDYIVDDNTLKIGLYTPGTHIPIYGIERLKKTNPEYLLILSWNFAEPIMEKMSPYKKTGVKFIIPLPLPTII